MAVACELKQWPGTFCDLLNKVKEVAGTLPPIRLNLENAWLELNRGISSTCQKIKENKKYYHQYYTNVCDVFNEQFQADDSFLNNPALFAPFERP